jgi:CBS domain-containing protein
VRIRDVYRPIIPRSAPSATLAEVAQTMIETDSGLAAIIDRERLVGVISERDLVRALSARQDPRGVPAGRYAASRVVTAALHDDTSDVARRMLEAGVRRLPVVDDLGEVIGVVSMRDLFAIETLIRAAPEEGARSLTSSTSR